MPPAAILPPPGQHHTEHPPSGPRILFFSGGTALRDTAHELTHHTHNSIHLITPFDSGGSSATLRRAFSMPAVGDLRARIMALADDHVHGNREIYTLFAYRLPKDDSPRALKAEMVRLVRGKHPLLRQIPPPMNGIIQDHLTWFALHMPEEFPLGGANVGNMILTAGYLVHRRRLNPVIALFSSMVRARGIVRPVTSVPAHLAVRLASGEIIVGQRNFTGKEATAITSPIRDIWLTASEDSAEPLQVAIHPSTAKLISLAECICYPVGSFYSSVVANLLPAGVGRSVAENPCPKIFVPNLGRDPELAQHTVETQVRQLLRPLLADAPGKKPADMLSAVLVDAANGAYSGGVPAAWLREQGISLIHAPLVSPTSAPLADSRLLAAALLQCASPA